MQVSFLLILKLSFGIVDNSNYHKQDGFLKLYIFGKEYWLFIINASIAIGKFLNMQNKYT